MIVGATLPFVQRLSNIQVVICPAGEFYLSVSLSHGVQRAMPVVRRASDSSCLSFRLPVVITNLGSGGRSKSGVASQQSAQQ